MFDELNKYENWGHFSVSSHSKLAEVCNAPKQESGVYLVYELKNRQRELVYIGCSGKMNTARQLQTRKTGGYSQTEVL